MKSIKAMSSLSVLLLLFSVLPVSVKGQFTFTTNNGAINITGYTGPTGAEVTIPDTIYGMPVTSVTGFAFAEVTSVAIGNNVTTIGTRAFWNCYASRITLGKDVIYIGDEAFLYTGFATMTIPASVASIGTSAFYQNLNLNSLFFAGNAPSLGSTAFYNDNKLIVFKLTGTTGWASTYGSRPVVLWNAQAQTSDGNFGLQGNGFGFSITGTANIPMVIEACTALGSGIWTPLQTCTLTNGSIYFNDPTWSNYPTRFYRIRSP